MHDFDLFSIDGYFKDSKDTFEGLIVAKSEVYDQINVFSEDSIFMFGMSESYIRQLIRLRDRTEYSFVITKYTPFFL